MTNSVDILASVDDGRKKATTKPLDVSLNELADMYSNGELIISPEYQRYFRWSETKQSQFIESLILEMPVPPFFVVEIEEGKWELIDGLQRMSTYLHFRGLLTATVPPSHTEAGDPSEGSQARMTLTLEGCDILKVLNGQRFDSLPTALQIRLKRAFMRVEVIRKDSDRRLRYHMFKRLNTGGEILSPQEVRNCTIRLLGSTFIDFVSQLSKNEDFLECVKDLTDEARNRRGDEELVLRFFAFKNDFGSFKHDIAPFLTSYLERVSEPDSRHAIPFDYEKESERFNQVFRVLRQTLGDKTSQAFRGSSFRAGFSMHHFEAFSLGVAQVINRINSADPAELAKLRSALEALKRSPSFQIETTGGGKNSPSAYARKIDLVKSAVEACYVSG